MNAVRIIRDTALAHGVTVDAVLSPSRKPELFIARIAIALRLKSERGLSGGQIALHLKRSIYQTKYYLNPEHRALRREIMLRRARRKRAQ